MRIGNMGLMYRTDLLLDAVNIMLTSLNYIFNIPIYTR